MDQHDRKFLPFDVSILINKEEISQDVSGTLPVNTIVGDKKLFTLVTGIPASDDSNFFRKDYIKYDEEFSKLAQEIVDLKYGNTERTLHTLLNQGIQNIIAERYVL